MKSKVYFIRVNESDSEETVAGKAEKLLKASCVLGGIKPRSKVAVKLHFGEDGNVGYVRPEYVKTVVDEILKAGGVPTLSDTNTLYHGKRSNPKDHLETARKHGFHQGSMNADIFIPDDNDKRQTRDVKVENSFIKSAKVAAFFLDADAIVAISHFKGHILTGFGGAIKNLGMGCAMREGKLAQHCDVAPVNNKDQCVGCGACVKVCPAHAIVLEDSKAIIDKLKCIGCAECILACPTNAMFIDMKAGDAVQKKMAEYAAAVIRNKKPVYYISFALRILKECDCWGAETPKIAPDTGIFASFDPVAIDKACLDMVIKAAGHDVFKEAHPDASGMIQLEHAAQLGLGSLDYELTELGS